MDHIDVGHRLSPVFRENILNSVLENAKEGRFAVLSGSLRNLALYIWMYGIYILACKEAVLLVGLLSELLLMRIPASLPQWAECCYLCQLFIICFARMPFFVGFPAGSCVGDSALWSDASEAASPFSDYSSTMIYAAILLLTGAVFVVLITIGPVMRTLFCFDAWGQRKPDQRAFLYGIFSHAASFQQQIVHGHSSFYH